MNRWKFLAIYVPCALLCYGIEHVAGVKDGTGPSAAIGWGGGFILTLLILLVLWRRRERGKRQCPACGRHGVDIEVDHLWVCAHCIANGPVISDAVIDLGLSGLPRGGEWIQRTPHLPVAVQMSVIAPELAQLSHSKELLDRFDEACFRWYFAMHGTSFDIEDPELEAAEAVNARNLLAEPNARADEARFYVLTAFSTSGWQWRVAEEAGSPGKPAEVTEQWLDRYRSTSRSRSEVVGLVAVAIADDASLDEHSPGGAAAGHAFLTGGWLLAHGSGLGEQSQVTHVHPVQLLQRSFRFGVALRDAQVAYDRPISSQVSDGSDSGEPTKAIPSG